MNWAKIDKYNEERGRKLSFTGAELAQEFVDDLSVTVMEGKALLQNRIIDCGEDLPKLRRGEFFTLGFMLTDFIFRYACSAAKHGYKTALFITERDELETALKMLTILSGVPRDEIKDGMTEKTWRTLVDDGFNVLESLPITFHFGKHSTDAIIDAVIEDGAEVIIMDNVACANDYDNFYSGKEKCKRIGEDLLYAARQLDALIVAGEWYKPDFEKIESLKNNIKNP